MDDLLLHDKTRLELGRFIKSGNHALLLTGQLGSGTYTVAVELIKKLLDVPDITNVPYYLHMSDHDKAISIEDIRTVQNFLQLKTTGDRRIRRVVLLENADTMQVEAQNALLKSLEEPPLDTVLILTAARPQSLRQTIHSRLQRIDVTSAAQASAQDYFSAQGHSEKDITWAFNISDGQAGLMSLLLQNKSEHALTSQLETAKSLYKMTAFERLAKVDEIAKQKETLPSLLFACKRICRSALEQAAKKQQIPQLKSWYRQLSIICDAEESIQRNVNTKLLLTDLFVRM